ncbi:hypothetical protein MAR_017977 [Mya arenaria]|uniref:Uncharacterized protein n=1 Tax=Mya arenaria TaxID=6604 RepID=A0ABY7EG07_MYAAR|nr:uncharacterized protein LOC128239110 [Mya arenaria]WAR08019.1 hypothetical protein MAR_017977 [Mya arenaria]
MGIVYLYRNMVQQIHGAKEFMAWSIFATIGLLFTFSIWWVDARTIPFVPCGDTFCKEPGYEACLQPPEVNSAFCCPCDRLKDPCNVVTPRQGCHLFCQDKVLAAREGELNKTMADALENLEDNKQQDIREYQNKIRELQMRSNTAEAANAALSWGTAALAVVLIAVIVGILIYRCRRRCRTEPREAHDPTEQPETPEEDTLLKTYTSSNTTIETQDSGAYVEKSSISSSHGSGGGMPNGARQDPRKSEVVPLCSVDRKCKDERFSQMSPQQNDKAVLCPSGKL